MRISLVLSGPPIWWKICRESPSVLDVVIDQYKLVNPLFVRSTLSRNTDSLRETIMFPSESEILFSSSEIGLVKIDESVQEIDHDYIFNLFSNFLSWVRYLSFQIEIPSIPNIHAASSSIEVADTLTNLDYNEVKIKGYIRANIINNSVDENIIKESAYKVSINEHIPIYYKFLLDAYANYKAQDYRQCYLDLAVSVESYINIKMEQEYRSKITQKFIPEMRIIDIPQSGNTTIRKDPIYDMLIEKTDFSSLLHELPLYLLGKSIMIDNPDTYRVGITLYRTRNKIVHKGEPNKNEVSKCFSMTSEDAQKALKCVKDIFEWFGDKFTYPLEGMLPYTAIDNVMDE